jgi:hypothetical protein
VKLDGLLSAVQFGWVTEIAAFVIHEDPLAKFQNVVTSLLSQNIQVP